ncbi:MAG TPA: exosortase N [Chryseolinea sp.]|nr:exosortase N [Chryseolinea sp.]
MSPLLTFGMRWMVSKRYHTLAMFLCAGLAGGIIAFPASFFSGTNVLLGCCLLPLAIFFHQKQRLNITYLLLMVFFGVVAYVYSVRTFYFFMIAFYLLFLLELWIGKIDAIILFLMAFMSPFFHQISVILGFPIRLTLSQWAGATLSFAGFDIIVEGNTMLLKGTSFSVDEACMGLSMLAVSLLMGIAAMVHHYRQSGLRLSLFALGSFFFVVLLLNLISNLLRIMLLVIFKVLPDHPMHDVVGVLCLIGYVVVPLYFVSRLFINKFGKHALRMEESHPLNLIRKSLLVISATAIVVTGIHVNMQRIEPVQIAHATIEPENFKVSKMEQGITKLYNDEMLVYVKPIPEFFTGEHTPLLCWKGSGFEFRGVKKVMVAGKEIYSGRLEKPGETLFTAWWYDNGETVTIDQWNWRVRMLKHERKFSLINVTVNDETTLSKNVKLIFEKKWLAQER